jgi:hypothetical protein
MPHLLVGLLGGRQGRYLQHRTGSSRRRETSLYVGELRQQRAGLAETLVYERVRNDEEVVVCAQKAMLRAVSVALMPIRNLNY